MSLLASHAPPTSCAPGVGKVVNKASKDTRIPSALNKRAKELMKKWKELS